MKETIEGNMINDHFKIPHTLLVFYKVLYFQDRYSKKFKKIYLLDRNWKEELKDFIKKNELNIEFYFNIINFTNFNFRSFLKKLILINKPFNIFKSKKIIDLRKNKKNKIYFDKLGEFNLKKNFRNSDFFFYLYSKLNSNDITFETIKFNELQDLKKEGIEVVTKKFNYLNFIKFDYNYFSNQDFNKYLKKNKIFNQSFFEYAYTRNYWKFFFKKNNIKLYLTWFKFRKFHIPITDAINEIDGVSAVWERSFENQLSPDLYTVSNILFKQSFWNIKEAKLNNKCEYFISTCFLRDYAKNEIIQKAKIIKKNNFDVNVNYIFSVFDQNSNDNFTHKLLNNNYINILKFILSKKDLGVVFKPKKSQTLFDRLSNETVELINYAKKIKKCYIFEDYGEHQSNIPAILAAYISDLCIHTSLKAGTAAIECALSNKPTVIIDQEGYPYSKLNELRQYDVIYDSWEAFIDKISFLFKNKKVNYNFGKWGNFVEQFDDFKDGNGAKRMGDYIKDIISGFDNGYNSKKVLRDAYLNYKKVYGNKIATSIYD